MKKLFAWLLAAALLLCLTACFDSGGDNPTTVPDTTTAQTTAAAPEATEPPVIDPKFDATALFNRLEGFWNIWYPEGGNPGFVGFTDHEGKPGLYLGVWDGEGGYRGKLAGGQSIGEGKVALDFLVPAAVGQGISEYTMTIRFDIADIDDGDLGVQFEYPSGRLGEWETYTYSGKTMQEALEKAFEKAALPTYVSGSIKLTPGGIGGDFEFTPTKRRLYYKIPGPFTALIPEGTIDDLFEKDKDIYSEPQEMVLVTLIKHCGIPRQDFEKAVNEYIKMCASTGSDMAHEDFEIPNADIIYTFDNEIIDAYYRRG